jgi:ubiquitin-protein ligase
MSLRIQREIKKGYESTNFEFFYDETGKYGELEVAYIKFTPLAGTFTGQTHILKIKFVYGSNTIYTFPRDPPNIIFLTPIFHTNISTGGSICLDVIKPEKWAATYGIETIFMSIIALLDDPNTSSPFNRDASAAFTTMKPEIYKKNCQDYYLKLITGNDMIKKILHADEWNSKPSKKEKNNNDKIPDNMKLLPPKPSASSAPNGL